MAKPSTVKKKKQELKDLFIKKKREILADVRRSMEAHLEEDARLSFEVCQDNADKSVDELLKHVNAAIIGNRSEEIDKIDEALRKLEEGTYGVCEECSCDIPVKRLKVIPFATCCVMCQNEIDKKIKARAYREEKGDPAEGFDDYLSEEE